MKRLSYRFPTRQISGVGAGLVPATAGGGNDNGRKRPLQIHKQSRQYFSSYYLSPWHFLSPWLSGTNIQNAPSVSSKFDTRTRTAKLTPSPLSLWETTTSRLLDTEPGSLDSFQLHTAERALSWWTANNSHAFTIDAVGWTFQLLERLEEEVVACNNRAEEYHSNGAEDILTYETISLSVHKWRLVLKEGSKKELERWKEEMDDLSPGSLLQKMASYAATSHNFRLDAAMYNMILDVIGIWYSDSDVPGQVRSLLESMESHNPAVAPDSITYTSAIHVLASMDHRLQAAERSLHMLRAMQKAASINREVYPTICAYGSVIGALARSIHSCNEKLAQAQQAEDLVREMQADWNLKPNTLVYSHVLHAWAQTAAPEAGSRGHAILKAMLEQHFSAIAAPNREGQADSCKPNNYCFSSVMTAYAKHGYVDDTQQLLKQLQHLYDESYRDADMFPNTFCFNALMEAWVNCRSIDTVDAESHYQSNARQVESVLQQMVAYSKKTGRDDCLPNLVSYNLVLDAYAKEQVANGDPTQASRRALVILKHIKDVGFSPDTISYNCVLECLAKCAQNGSSRSAQKWAAATAEGLVSHQMPLPDVISYRNLIRAAGNAERAERILKDMRCGSGNRAVLPDRACFNAAITQWSRSQSPHAGHRAEALCRVMKLEQNIDPDVVTYNAMMECWRSVAANNPKAADRAWSILRTIQKQPQHSPYKQTWRSKIRVHPNSISYTTCIWAFAAAKQPEKAEQAFRELEEASREDSSVKPNIISYCALISAWARVGRPQEAQAIFDALVYRSSVESGKDQDESLRPNTAVYSSLLHAWATAGEVGHAVAILQRMCEDYATGKNGAVVPDERCFSAVIGALSRSKHPDAAPQAEDCLETMQKMADNGLDNVRPNIHTYQGAISAWANSDLPIAAERAEVLLSQLKQLYHEQGYVQCRPNVIAYTNTLRAWSRVSCQNNRYGGYHNSKLAVERSEALLMEMLQSKLPDLQPNRITYGTILRTIAESRLPDKASRAERIVQIMKKNGVALDGFARDQVQKANSCEKGRGVFISVGIK